MNEWSPGREDGPDVDRIALDSEGDGDLDEAVQEAVEAVEAAAAASRGGGEGPHLDNSAVAVKAVEDEVEVEVEAEDEAEVEDEDTLDLETMATLRVELEELRERTTRTLADFDNYRKRVEREKQAQQRYSGMEVLRGLLDIVDNLERALVSDGPVSDLKAGVELTLRQAEDLMRRHGVKRIEADGVAFDPSFHEAVSRQEEEGLVEPKVTAVLQSGYQMHERLLRPVRVVVAVPVVGEPERGGEES